MTHTKANQIINGVENLAQGYFDSVVKKPRRITTIPAGGRLGQKDSSSEPELEYTHVEDTTAPLTYREFVVSDKC